MTFLPFLSSPSSCVEVQYLYQQVSPVSTISVSLSNARIETMYLGTVIVNSRGGCSSAQVG